MADPFLGEIRLFAGAYAPYGWLPCDGRLLEISDHMELYLIIGTTYGGNGTTTFQLPNLMGRLPIGQGKGPGLTDHPLGEKTGTKTVTLGIAEVPAHGHPFNVTNRAATTVSPGPSVGFANPPADMSFYIDTAQPTKGTLDFSPHAVSVFGSGNPHVNTMPTMTLSYIICVSGEFPEF
jgi:microcystin-dependent protein